MYYRSYWNNANRGRKIERAAEQGQTYAYGTHALSFRLVYMGATFPRSLGDRKTRQGSFRATAGSCFVYSDQQIRRRKQHDRCVESSPTEGSALASDTQSSGVPVVGCYRFVDDLRFITLYPYRISYASPLHPVADALERCTAGEPGRTSITKPCLPRHKWYADPSRVPFTQV